MFVSYIIPELLSSLLLACCWLFFIFFLAKPGIGYRAVVADLTRDPLSLISLNIIADLGSSLAKLPPRRRCI